MDVLLSKWPWIYLIFISVLSAVVTCYDKYASKALTQWRTRERTLLLLAAAGGSLAMYLTMLLIRHKTLHLKFMLGIPVILLCQVIAVWLWLHFNVGNRILSVFGLA